MIVEKIKQYSFVDRLKYTYSRNFFCKRKFLFFMIPYVASNMDIHIDYIWRDLMVKRKKKEKSKLFRKREYK